MEHYIFRCFVFLVAMIISSQALAQSTTRLIVLVNESDVDRVTHIDDIANYGIEVIVLAGDRYANLDKDFENLEQRINFTFQTRLQSDPDLASLVQSAMSLTEDERTARIQQYITTVPEFRQHIAEFNTLFSRLKQSVPEARVIGEISTKLAIDEMPTVVLEDSVGYKAVTGTVNLEQAMILLSRRDYHVRKR